MNSPTTKQHQALESTDRKATLQQPAYPTGQKPNHEQLERALAEAISERNSARETCVKLATWLGKLSAAHARADARTVGKLLDSFAQENATLTAVCLNCLPL